MSSDLKQKKDEETKQKEYIRYKSVQQTIAQDIKFSQQK